MKNKYLYILVVFQLLSLNLKAQNGCIGTAGEVKWNYWLNFETYPDSAQLHILEYFPSKPDGSLTLGSLETPLNFSNYFASNIKGYIKVPSTGSYYFNIVGDDESTFYLSTNDLPANLIKRASINSYANFGDHYVEPEQTSPLITLNGGQYYYFEMYNYEGGGGDHMTLYWRKPNSPDTDTVWTIVDFNYISSYTCGQSCPDRGTNCDDGNPNTSNDIQDGFCNCVGTPPTSNACIGERASLEAYYFDDITGNYVEYDLINSPKFPLTPDRKENLKGLHGPFKPGTKDQYGSLVQGYLTVPVSGTYEFVLTGDNQTFFYMSKNDSIEFKQYHQALVMYGVGETEINASSFQKIAPLYLQKNKYYYFEIRHKDNTWRDYFNIYWKTPFHEEKTWKKIPAFYLYDYACDISCIAQGTPCDDGNAFTNNDQYDANCNCVGTPCTGLDCDDSMAKYKYYEECASTNELITDPKYSWFTCDGGLPNPNPTRGSGSRWIKYDFGHQYQLKGTRIWNYNVTNDTDKGMQQVVVDFSADGVNWTALGGTYTWPQAPGSADYAGLVGPNFNDIKARYVLFTALQNWGDPSCSGMSKITFDAVHCDNENTSCDDGDPLTSYDKFDNNCQCRGIDINCASDTLALQNQSLTNGEFKARKNIISKNTASNNQNISFTAGNSIVLLPGFKTDANATFTAKIEDCLREAFTQNQVLSLQKTEQNSLFGESNTNQKLKQIIFRINQPGPVSLKLFNSKGNNIATIIEGNFEILGTQVKNLPTNRLPKGTYTIELIVNGNTVKESFSVL